jgi:hypothetical protein
MIIYKYLQPARIDVLRNRSIRFTQPAGFNDPFEFRPCIQALASDDELRSHVEKHFEHLVNEELAKYGTLIDFLPQDELRSLLLKGKASLPTLFRFLEPGVIQKLSLAIDEFFNRNVGVLCLSEARDSILMWGHYTENHSGFVVGFDSETSFFSKRRSNTDDFGFLCPVHYTKQRPRVTLADTTSVEWFQSKSDEWSYEKEWRILRVLSEADCRIEQSPLPICLFRFEPDAVREIAIGMRAAPSLRAEIERLAPCFPRVSLFAAHENPAFYSLMFDKLA